MLRTDDGRTWIVASARKAGAEIVHELELDAGAEPPAVGERVTAEVDWARRHALMRTHTALHTLCGVVWRDYGALVTGGNMEPGAGRMDFEFERMSGELVDEIEAKVNTELALARDVRVDVLPRAVAFEIPDLIRTKVNLLPPGIEQRNPTCFKAVTNFSNRRWYLARTARGIAGVRSAAAAACWIAMNCPLSLLSFTSA